MALEVSDLDLTLRQLSVRGIHPVWPTSNPVPEASVCVNFIRDPEGNVIELVEQTRSR